MFTPAYIPTNRFTKIDVDRKMFSLGQKNQSID